MGTSFKIHIVFSILYRNPKICYYLNKILLSDLTLLYCFLYLYIRISCKEIDALLLLHSVSIEQCIFSYHYKYFIGTFHFSENEASQSNLYKTNTLGTTQKWSSRKGCCLLKHLQKTTTRQMWSL